jgi:TadE-like protein
MHVTTPRVTTRSRKSGRAGQALVEFGLVAILALTLIVGVIQLGFVLYAGAVLTGAVQDGATRAAQSGATPEDGRRRTLDLLAAGRVLQLGRWTVTAADLGETVQVGAAGDLPYVVPLGGLTIRLTQRHAATKEYLRP